MLRVIVTFEIRLGGFSHLRGTRFAALARDENETKCSQILSGIKSSNLGLKGFGGCEFRTKWRPKRTK